MQLAAILPVALRAVTYLLDLVFVFTLSFTSSDLMYSYLYVSYGMLSTPWSVIFSTNVFMSASAAVYLLVTTASVRNGGRKMAFMEVQSWSFFDLDRLATVARSSNSVYGRHILSPFSEKEHSTSIDTTVGALRYHARENQRPFPQGTCYQWTHTRTLPGCLQAWRSWWVLPD